MGIFRSVSFQSSDTRHLWFAVIVTLCALALGSVGLSGCSDDSSRVDGNKLCRGESGFGARIEGTPSTIDMCVSDAATLVELIPVGIDESRYLITAEFVSDSLTIQCQVGFFLQPAYPVTLSLTADRGLAESDPGSAWFYYQETKLGTYDVVSSAVTGTFSVVFNDSSIAVATFSSMLVELEDVSTGDPAGSRTVSEGYVSVTRE